MNVLFAIGNIPNRNFAAFTQTITPEGQFVSQRGTTCKDISTLLSRHLSMNVSARIREFVMGNIGNLPAGMTVRLDSNRAYAMFKQVEGGQPICVDTIEKYIALAKQLGHPSATLSVLQLPSRMPPWVAQPDTPPEIEEPFEPDPDMDVTESRVNEIVEPVEDEEECEEECEDEEECDECGELRSNCTC